MTDQRTDPPATVAVVVTRSGGIAGLRREWSVAPSPDDAPRWIALIESCPWDAVGPMPPDGADRYAWHIRARCTTAQVEREHDVRLQDPQIEGPWLALIEEVRASSGA